MSGGRQGPTEVALLAGLKGRRLARALRGLALRPA